MNETVSVLVRYFAGAAAAAGRPEERLSLAVGTTVGSLTSALADRDPALAKVLAASSFLLDGVATRPGDVLPDDAVLDVLPPFAGG